MYEIRSKGFLQRGQGVWQGFLEASTANSLVFEVDAPSDDNSKRRVHRCKDI
jgi:hypothetical protein